jgi:hypothetical protein
MSDFITIYDDIVWKWRMGVITYEQFLGQWAALLWNEERKAK